jgi:hypothetical protein
MAARPAKPVFKINGLPASLAFEQPHFRSEIIAPSADIGRSGKLTNEIYATNEKAARTTMRLLADQMPAANAAAERLT